MKKRLATLLKENENGTMKLILANKEHIFQNEENEKETGELVIFNNSKIAEGKRDEEYTEHY